MIDWVLAAASIAGTVYNVRKRMKASYAIWTVADIAWVAYAIATQVYGQVFLFSVFTLFSIWGFVEVRHREAASKHDLPPSVATIIEDLSKLLVTTARYSREGHDIGDVIIHVAEELDRAAAIVKTMQENLGLGNREKRIEAA